MKIFSKEYIVGRIKFLPTLILLLFFLPSIKAEMTFSIPDFAFPKSAEKTSRENFSLAVEEKNQLGILRYAMDICIAESLSGNDDYLERNLSLLDSVSQLTSGVYRQLSYLIRAEILLQEFKSNQFNYTERNLPEDSPLPSNIKEWSGDAFKMEIYRLVGEATSTYDSPSSSGLQLISPLIKENTQVEKAGMTVEDFIIIKGAQLLESCSTPDSQTLIPFYPEETRLSVSGLCASKAQSLLNEIADDSSHNPVMRALACREMFSLIPDYEKEQFLNKAIDSLKGTEGEGILLYQKWVQFNESSMYGFINEWISKYPDGPGVEQLKYVLSVLTHKNIDAQFPSVALPKTPIKGKVNMSNIEKGYLLVYKLSPSQTTVFDELIPKKFDPASKPVQTVLLEASGVVPFNEILDIEISPLEEGLYAIVPSLTPELSKNRLKESSGHYSCIRISDLAVITSFDSNQKDSGRVYVVKGENQEPVEGASVKYYSGNSSKPIGVLSTNNEGYVSLPTGYYRVEVAKGKSLARAEAGISYYPDSFKESDHISILTDLRIYRPGDIMKFVLTGWKQKENSNCILKDTPVKVTLKDANYQDIDTCLLVLNNEGRSEGNFTLPTDRMNGMFSLLAEFPEITNGFAGTAFFSVEEYRTPSFNVVLEQDSIGGNSNISLKVKAVYSTGIPVAEAKVDFNIMYSPLNPFPYGPRATYKTSISSDAEGNFYLELPIDNLKGTPFETGRYSVTAEVTSPLGETNFSTPLYFNLGKYFSIRPDIKDKIKIDSDFIKLYSPVYDASGMPTIQTVNYEIINLSDSTKTLSGSFPSPNLDIPSSDIPSGRFRIELWLENSKEKSVTETILWRASDNQAPYPTPLWIPQNLYFYSENETEIDVKFGSYWKDWILYFLSDGDDIIENGWISPADTLTDLRINIPRRESVLFLTISGMHDFQSSTETITIRPDSYLEKPEISVESFRSNITAGNEENWSFKFTLGDKPLPFVNAYAVMTDKALNALSDFKWNFGVWKHENYNKFHLFSRNPGNRFSYGSFSPILSLSSSGLEIPDWQTYNYPWINFRGGIQNTMLYKAMQSRVSSKESISENEDSVVAYDEVNEESSLATGQGIPETVSEEYRPVEMPIAFFMTDLKGDADGVVNLNFKVPDFNTTWQLQIAAYDTAMQTVVQAFDVVSTKPVMTKTVMPRYVQTGDKIEISAQYFNNTSDSLEVAGGLEIYNPFTGDLVSRQILPATLIGPSGFGSISAIVEIPNDLTLVEVLSYAATGNCRDAERGYIPVLPASAPVIDSRLFYAGSGDAEIEMSIPKLQKDAQVTLKYCDNPLWDVVLSMPPFNNSLSSTSLETMANLYAVLTTYNIIQNNTAIKERLNEILQSSDSSVSSSRLERDEELKMMALQATPWLTTGKTGTLKIRSLGKYLDSDFANTQVPALMESLSSFQQKDGGFSWIPGGSSSPYITLRILGFINMLAQQGKTSPDLTGIATKANKYYENYLSERMKKDKKINPNEIIDYLYKTSYLKSTANKTREKLKSSALDSIKCNWRHLDILQKAETASVILDQPAYSLLRDSIVASLKEYNLKRIPLSSQPVLLDLFKKTGDTSLVEELREQILLAKETTDWSDNISLLPLIHSLLSTSPGYFTTGIPEIFIDGKPLELSVTQSLISDYTVKLDAKEVSGKKLLIKRSEGNPAWGGILSMSYLPVKDIKPSETENLRIAKHIYIEDGNGTLKQAKSVKRGDKITVNLVLTTDKEMDYVVVTDKLCAGLIPDQQISGYEIVDGLLVYRETGLGTTNFFIEHLPAGSHVISYSCHAGFSGQFSLGIAEAQSLYSPAQVAHSAGDIIKIY